MEPGVVDKKRLSGEWTYGAGCEHYGEQDNRVWKPVNFRMRA